MCTWNVIFSTILWSLDGPDYVNGRASLKNMSKLIFVLSGIPQKNTVCLCGSSCIQSLQKPNSWTYNFLSLRFLGILLRVLRLEVSVYKVIQTSFNPLLLGGGGGGSVTRGGHQHWQVSWMPYTDLIPDLPSKGVKDRTFSKNRRQRLSLLPRQSLTITISRDRLLHFQWK